MADFTDCAYLTREGWLSSLDQKLRANYAPPCLEKLWHSFARAFDESMGGKTRYNAELDRVEFARW